MFRAILITALLVPLAFVPHALAHECPVADEAIDLGGVYVTPTPGVFQETNGVPGLQSTAGSCVDDNGRDYSWAADTRII